MIFNSLETGRSGAEAGARYLGRALAGSEAWAEFLTFCRSWPGRQASGMYQGRWDINLLSVGLCYRVGLPAAPDPGGDCVPKEGLSLVKELGGSGCIFCRGHRYTWPQMLAATQRVGWGHGQGSYWKGPWEECRFGGRDKEGWTGKILWE